jgi:tRNA (cmo5U34)-methyltransferase
MKINDAVWQGDELTKTYLHGVRGAIPLANEQIEVMLHLVRATCPTVETALDLGCGDGILGQAVLDHYPAAHVIFADFSEPMLAAARQRLAGYKHVSFVNVDYGQPEWRTQVKEIINGQLSMSNCQFDVIISGFSIHHQPDWRKKEVYAELYDLLKPGGIFVNIEHVASRSRWIEQHFEAFFIDSLVRYHQQNGSGKTRAQISQDYYNRPDKEANILALVETQCDWLRHIGFVHVDCFLKIFELAVFGGVKPGP